MQKDADGASTAASDGNFVGVPSKSSDVALHPLQGCHLILEPIVTRGKLVASA